MSPSLEFLDSECDTCPTIPACPKRAETKGYRRA